MALPKEPRQKMINIMYLVLTAILALNVSNEVIEAFKTVDKSLQGSNSSLTASTNTVFKSLTDKMADEKTAEQAKIWQPKAEQVEKLSKELDSYLEGLKKKLKEGAGLKIVTKDGKEVEDFKEDNLDASTRIFETGGEGKKLEQALIEYKTKVLAIDPEIKAAFAQNFPVDLTPVVGRDGKQKDFTTGYFHMTPTVAALTMLSKFQNNIKNAENQVVSFCHSKVGEVKVRYDKFGVLVGQSSNYLMPGQELEITAGIGAYSSAAQPKISIGGTGVATIDGKGVYKTTVSGAGARKVPVSISYVDQNGQPQTATAEVEYVVGTPGGAAVMLDKMNVFYIGVDNPVTISSGTGWDKTTVSMAGGTISGSNSNRTVRVTGGTTASITVTAEGKSSKFDFRIKRIPDPVFKVGSGKSRMPTVEFKNQQYCRADLENFDFDLKYSVVSANVYFLGGSGFPSVVPAKITGNNFGSIANLIQRCTPGTSISFEDIKVSGPDGVRSIEGRTFQLY